MTCKQTDSYHAIAEIAKKARKAGMSYGQYVACSESSPVSKRKTCRCQEKPQKP